MLLPPKPVAPLSKSISHLLPLLQTRILKLSLAALEGVAQPAWLHRNRSVCVEPQQVPLSVLLRRTGGLAMRIQLLFPATN